MRSGLGDAQASSGLDSLDAVVDTELFVAMGGVDADSAWVDIQFLGEGVIGLTACQPTEHLRFAGRESAAFWGAIVTEEGAAGGVGERERIDAEPAHSLRVWGVDQLIAERGVKDPATTDERLGKLDAADAGLEQISPIVVAAHGVLESSDCLTLIVGSKEQEAFDSLAAH